MTRKRNNSAIALHMQKAMQVQARTYHDLSVISGLSDAAVRYWVKQLRDMKPSPIHVASFAEDSRGRPLVPQFAWGTKKDVPRVGKELKGSTRRMAAMRARHKREGA